MDLQPLQHCRTLVLDLSAKEARRGGVVVSWHGGSFAAWVGKCGKCLELEAALQTEAAWTHIALVMGIWVGD